MWFFACHLIALVYMLSCMIRHSFMRPHIIRANTFTIYFIGLLLILGFNVALPTETVYGLFAVYWHADAVDGIYKKKGRNRNNPLIVHVSCLEDVKKYSLTNMKHNEQIVFEAIASKVWPGACTIVARADKARVIPSIRNDTDFVGIRIPDEESTRKVLKIAGPCVGPSANPSGKISPTNADHVYSDYKGRPVFIPILKSSVKTTKIHGIESTIVQVFQEDTGVVVIKILRAGAIGAEQIREILDDHIFDFQYTIDINIDSVNNHTSVAPGQEITHYAPDTRTFIGTTDHDASPPANREKAVLIATEQIIAKYGSNYQKSFILPSTDEKCAAELYTIMREADAYSKKNQAKAIVICTEGLSIKNMKSGYIDAIHDKLVRASSGSPPIIL